MHITMKYKKKIRLLVTNQCARNCAYCHNEGMKKTPAQHLLPNRLAPFLDEIKRYSNRIVISGGEPFEYPYLVELVDLLWARGFDLTVLSANINEEILQKVGNQVKDLHYSIHALECLSSDASVIRRINQQFPSLRLAINVPFSSLDVVRQNWSALYRLALEVGANIQLIRLFTPGTTRFISSRWEDRWNDTRVFLESFSTFLEATERETRYVTTDYIKIDLLDIPCIASGMEFKDGACLTNSDLTIDPHLCVSICRWGEHGIPLYSNDTPRPFDSAVMEATVESCRRCSFGEINGY